MKYMGYSGYTMEYIKYMGFGTYPNQFKHILWISDIFGDLVLIFSKKTIRRPPHFTGTRSRHLARNLAPGPIQKAPQR